MLYREYSSNKMKQNIEKYIHFDREEKVEVILDLTIFGEGKKGMICTNKRFIKYNKTKLLEYPIDTIHFLEAREVNPERYEYHLILTDNEGREHNLTEKSIPNDELKVFVYIISTLHNLKSVS